MITKPITPAIIRFLASSTLSSLPCAVIHLNPPSNMIITAIMPRKPSTTFITPTITSIGVFVPRPTATATFAEVPSPPVFQKAASASVSVLAFTGAAKRTKTKTAARAVIC